MKNYASYVFLAIIIGWVTAGCTPTLIGSPENSGLILVEGKITMLRTHSIDNAIIQIRNPTKRRWESIASNKGKQFGNYIVFDNLKPGDYRLRRVSSYVGEGGWSTLSINFRRTTRYVNAGQPVYVGKIIINWNLENKTKWESDIKNEIAAWQFFLKEYKDSPWTVPIQDRLRSLGVKPKPTPAAAPVTVTARPTATFEEGLETQGYKRLNAAEIQSTLAGNTVTGKFGASGYPFTIFVAADGTVRGMIVLPGRVEKDKGRWKVSKDNLYCDQWEKWQAPSDCDRIYLRGKETVFVNPDGSLSSSGTVEQGNSKGL